MLATPAPAQPARVAFDYRSELKAPHEASVLARGDFSGDGLPDLAVAGPGHLTVFEQGANSYEWKIATGPASQRTPVMAAAGRLNADSRDDMVLLCGSRPAIIEIYLTGASNLPVLTSSIEIPGDFQQISLADLDADRNADILLCGKKNLGITVYTGNGRGGFTAGPVLFPEISVSQAVVSLMDDDDVSDIALVDWIGNRVQVFPGFGKLNYSDALVLPFDDEPQALAVGDLNGDKHRDIVVGLGEHPAFVIYAGDGSGNYAELDRGNLGAPPEKIRVGDIEGDSRNDLLMYLPRSRSVVVRYQDRSGLFRTQQSYAAGPAPADVIFFQDSRRRFLNSAVLSADEGVVRILHNRSGEFPGPAGWMVATGNDPADLEIADLNDDGWADVALTQTSEPVLSFFLNNGKGSLNGQASLPLPAPMTGLISLGSGQGEKDFLATGPDGTTISYLSLNPADLSMTSVSVRADVPVEAIDGRRWPDDHGRRIYVMRGGRGGAGGPGGSLLAYDAVDRTRSEEIDLHIVLPDRIVATTPHDFDDDGLRDIALLTVPDTGSQWRITVYRQTADGFEPDRVLPVRFPDSRSSGVTLWIADLNGDGSDDLILNVQKPANILAVAMARGDTAFEDALIIQTDVRIPFRKSLSVTDFDSDGRTDLVFVNERTRTVQFLPGDGTGRYSGPVNLTSARGVRSFGIGDLNRDSEKELILTIADEGILSVTTFHHPLFERKISRNRE
ncbi:MAG TPA: VCBS repeat-containing protein [Bacteroidota bacterium]|nr:VCBS repeat-containing protein [Bacteroidota bacterium]